MNLWRATFLLAGLAEKNDDMALMPCLSTLLNCFCAEVNFSGWNKPKWISDKIANIDNSISVNVYDLVSQSLRQKYKLDSNYQQAQLTALEHRSGA